MPGPGPGGATQARVWGVAGGGGAASQGRGQGHDQGRDEAQGVRAEGGRHRDEGDEVPGRRERRRFEHLLSHKTDFLKNKQKTEDIKLLYEETEEFLRDEMPSFDTFIEILGRLYINGFEICDSEMQTYGWGVYLGVR